MLRPPGVPRASSGWPLRNTITGAIDDIGRRPGRRRFATGCPPIEGRKAKSVSWLFSTIPATRCRLPNTVSTELV